MGGVVFRIGFCVNLGFFGKRVVGMFFYDCFKDSFCDFRRREIFLN